MEIAIPTLPSIYITSVGVKFSSMLAPVFLLKKCAKYVRHCMLTYRNPKKRRIRLIRALRRKGVPGPPLIPGLLCAKTS